MNEGHINDKVTRISIPKSIPIYGLQGSVIVDNEILRLDTLIPYEYWEALRRRNLEPEQRLMSAVVVDAIVCFLKYVHARDKKKRQLFEYAKDYILEQDRDWPFSFDNVWEIFGKDPSYVRQGLLRWEEREKAGSHAYKK